MKAIRSCILAASLAASATIAIAPAVAAAPDRVQFNRDVRPILSDTCFKCHGPDKQARKGDLRLDLADEAVKPRKHSTPIVRGDSAKSEIYRRLVTPDRDDHMPPLDSGLKLTPAQVATIKRWIEEGAEYQPLWSLIRVEKPAPPPVKNSAWVRNPIDRFILARLERESLKPNPEADKATLLRRVTLDLTGLPPTLAEIDAFLADGSAEAYQRIVDRLLESPRYGERMALDWLDAARYADTHGYHIDSGRDMTVWREWVIDAFNGNMPFDQFTVEQLAGDLLPDATLDQKVASGFNRNNMINFEGGAIPEEYLTQYIIDRVNTTSTVWLGLTVGCAQCHDHKYDPITQKDFYRLYAFFNAVPENGLDGSKGNAAPVIQSPSKHQRAAIRDRQARIAELEAKLKARETESVGAAEAWAAGITADATPPEPAGLIAHFKLDEGRDAAVADATGKIAPGQVRGEPHWGEGKIGGGLQFDGAGSVDLGDALPLERDQKFSYGAWIFPTSMEHGAVLARMDGGPTYRGFDLYLGGGLLYAHLISQWEGNAVRVNTKQPLKLNQWHHVMATYDGSSKAEGLRVYVDGKLQDVAITHNSLTQTIRTDKHLRLGSREANASFKGTIDDVRFYDRQLGDAEVASLAGGSDPLKGLAAIPAAQRTPEQKMQLARIYLQTQDKPYAALVAELSAVRSESAKLDTNSPTTMVMQDMANPRDTFILIRGQYDKHGEKVTPGVPASMAALPEGAAVNRLALARWLVDRNQPLTSRVVVNRYWQSYFGNGIVKTSDDFGSQGDEPVHPALLDWLAASFMEEGWDVKQIQRLIVTSATYRQSSKATPELLARDPENRLLARGPRHRLKAEFIRDQALAVSGLLDPRIGGPSVSPYQPAGIWEELSFRADNKNWTAQTYEQSKGRDLYRRTMYTFWKRTAPPPTLLTFDAPDRETCTVRRAITNTPLQALVLMNDPTYVEASRKLAERMMTQGGATPAGRIKFAFRLATARPPRAGEVAVLEKVFNEQKAVFAADPEAAKKLLAVGDSPRDQKLDTAELAAWTLVASAILNLDETITKG
jgi:hypothetical protein